MKNSLSLCLILAVSMTSVVIAEQKPNIILVLTDDQGYGDIRAHGHPYIQTPHLDALYEKSIRFTDYHVSSTCAPTRAALMTGMSPFKVGVTHTVLERERLALGFKTVADVLKKSGYTSGIFGKWHLGDADPYQPENRGFDEVFIHGAGGIGQNFPGTQGAVPGTSYFDPIIKHNGTFVKTSGYCTDVFFQQSMAWMEQNIKAKQPFFAYIPTNAPHGPFIVADKYKELYEAKAKGKKNAASFFGMITNIDENMGVLMKQLGKWGVEENTILIFMTDNGSARGAQIFNAGMKGNKGSLNEGGSRVPFFWYWKGRHEGGKDIDTLTRHIDILPTFSDIADATLPTENVPEGRNLLPLLDGDSKQWEDRYVFFHRARWGDIRPKKDSVLPNPDDYKDKLYSVRDEQWRLVEKKLYNIVNDPSEKNDVASQNPEIVLTMKTAYDKWWDESRDGMVNEGASLDTGKPFIEAFNEQLKKGSIPQWKNPNYK